MRRARCCCCAACSAPGVLKMAQEGFAEARQALGILAAQAAEAAKAGYDACLGSLEPDLPRLAAQYQALGRLAAQNAVAVKVAHVHMLPSLDYDLPSQSVHESRGKHG